MYSVFLILRYPNCCSRERRPLAFCTLWL